jgi:hypothetical protein
MAVIAKILFRSHLVSAEVETVETIILFCCVGLFVSLLLTIEGVDVGAGFF